MPRPAAPPPPPEDFPVPFYKFAKELVGTEDEIFLKLMSLEFAGKNMLPAEWRKKLEALKKG